MTPPRPAILGRRSSRAVEGDLAVPVHHRQRRQCLCRRTHFATTANLRDHPSDTCAGDRLGRRPGQQQLLYRSGPSSLARHGLTGDGKVAGVQHVGPHPAGQRVKDRRRPGPVELPHRIGRQNGHWARVGVDRGGNLVPARRIADRTHLAPHTPGQIRQHQQQRCARRRADDGGREPPQRHDGARRRHRVAGDGHRDPLLPVPKYAEARHRFRRRAQQLQARPGCHHSGPGYRRRGQHQQWDRGAAP